MSKKTVYVVHCIDVEGPMHEPIEATFERLRDEDRIDHSYEPTEENLKKLQTGKLAIGVSPERANFLARKYCEYNLGYQKSWPEIDESMGESCSPEFRQKYSDGTGGDYVFSWFIFDQYGFSTNPRFKDDGVHNVFDHYHETLFNKNGLRGDGLYWHYHHPPSSGDAIEWNTNLWQNGVYEEILARRVIDRNWFPSVFRAGGHIERNDLNFWLEMFIPFDYSGRTPHGMDYKAYRGDVCDWRFSPKEWGYWHPDWYDYRRPGDMNRYIWRCLDLRTWIISLTERDVREAFERAIEKDVSVLAYYNHDYRDMRDEVRFAHELVSRVAKEYPDVDWKYANALDASLAEIGRKDDAPKLSWTLDGTLLTINSDKPLFGPMPFLAIQENDRYFRDNPTQESPTEWCYRFRKPETVQAFGIAANSPLGQTSVVVKRHPFKAS